MASLETMAWHNDMPTATIIATIIVAHGLFPAPSEALCALEPEGSGHGQARGRLVWGMLQCTDRLENRPNRALCAAAGSIQRVVYATGESGGLPRLSPIVACGLPGIALLDHGRELRSRVGVVDPTDLHRPLAGGTHGTGIGGAAAHHLAIEGVAEQSRRTISLSKGWQSSLENQAAIDGLS